MEATINGWTGKWTGEIFEDKPHGDGVFTETYGNVWRCTCRFGKFDGLSKIFNESYYYIYRPLYQP